MYNYFNNYLWIRKSCNFLVSHWHSTLPVYFTNNYHSFPFLLVFMEYLLFLPIKVFAIAWRFYYLVNKPSKNFFWLIDLLQRGSVEILWDTVNCLWATGGCMGVLFDWLTERTGKGSRTDREREWNGQGKGVAAHLSGKVSGMPEFRKSSQLWASHSVYTVWHTSWSNNYQLDPLPPKQTFTKRSGQVLHTWLLLSPSSRSGVIWWWGQGIVQLCISWNSRNSDFSSKYLDMVNHCSCPFSL